MATTEPEDDDNDQPERRRWTASGNARGDCGHLHRTYAAAAGCCDKDDAAIKRAPMYGRDHYSDRRPVQVDRDYYR